MSVVVAILWMHPVDAIKIPNTILAENLILIYGVLFCIV